MFKKNRTLVCFCMVLLTTVFCGVSKFSFAAQTNDKTSYGSSEENDRKEISSEDTIGTIEQRDANSITSTVIEKDQLDIIRKSKIIRLVIIENYNDFNDKQNNEVMKRKQEMIERIHQQQQVKEKQQGTSRDSGPEIAKMDKDIEEIKKQPNKPSFHHFEPIKAIIENTGLKVVAADIEDYDITMQIVVDGTLLSRNYPNHGALYTGAKMNWKISFISKDNKTIYSESFGGVKGPLDFLYATESSYQTMKDPCLFSLRSVYLETFPSRLIELAEKLKGIEPLIVIVKDTTLLPQSQDLSRPRNSSLSREPLKYFNNNTRKYGSDGLLFRKIAVENLSKYGLSAVEPLITVLADGKGMNDARDLQYCARRSLIKIGSPAIKPLITALKNDDSFIRANAAEVLGDIGDIQAIEPLTTTLKDEDSNVRESAARALEKIGDAQTLKN